MRKVISIGIRKIITMIILLMSTCITASAHYHISPYTYCGGNPVKYVDPDGKEKIYALEPNNEENKPIIIAAHKFQDNPNVVNIWAHGDSHSMSVYDKKTKHIIDIETGQQMHNFLMKNSHVYKNRKKGESISIVLHSCETGRTDNEGPSLAQKLSEQMKGVIVVAPNKVIDVNNKNYIELGVENGGQWNEYQEGNIVNRYFGNDPLPGSKEFYKNLSLRKLINNLISLLF